MNTSRGTAVAFNTTDTTSGSGSNGSNNHSPVLIPITFHPQQQLLATTSVDSTDEHNNMHQADSSYSNNNQNQNRTSLQLQEWAMIEINGELLLPSVSSSTSTTTTSTDDGTSSSTTTTTTNRTTIFDTRTNVELGSISFETCHSTTNTTLKQQTVPMMIIGTHELRGTIIELQQPFLCLQKTTKDDRNIDHSTNNDGIVHMIESDDEDNADRAITTSISTEYIIRGIIKYKFIFNQYPKTIMR